jgi:hypothetical protein
MKNEDIWEKYIKKPVPAQPPQQNQIQNWQITNLNKFNVNFIS